jgi:hypothetical protein
VVSWFGAIQAQDLGAAAWALALRCRTRPTKAQVDRLAADSLIRIHIMRPTWHFVVPDDVRWMLELSAPGMRRSLAYARRSFELDDETCRRAIRVFERELSDARHLTRTELGACLSRKKIVAKGPRLALLAVLAEIEGVICNGRPRGAQQTYALLSERVPQAATLDRDESIAELTRRFLRSHAPATSRDLKWWSGLTASDAKRGLELNRAKAESIDGLTYWTLPETAKPERGRQRLIHMLPVYDEYLVAYRDLRAVPRPTSTRGVLPQALAVDGQVVGTWARIDGKPTPRLRVALLGHASIAEHRALEAAVKDYATFLGIDDTLALECLSGPTPLLP